MRIRVVPEARRFCARNDERADGLGKATFVVVLPKLFIAICRLNNVWALLREPRLPVAADAAVYSDSI